MGWLNCSQANKPSQPLSNGTLCSLTLENIRMTGSLKQSCHWSWLLSFLTLWEAGPSGVTPENQCQLKFTCSPACSAGCCCDNCACEDSMFWMSLQASESTSVSWEGRGGWPEWSQDDWYPPLLAWWVICVGRPAQSPAWGWERIIVHTW